MVREKFIVHTPDGEATFEDIELAKDFALTFTPADEVYIDRAIEDIDEVVVKETIISKEDLVDLMKSPFDMEYDRPEYANPDELVVSEPLAVEEDEFRNMHEALEAREDLVECQECFELFPKSECRKLVYGYICPQCGQAYIEKEIPVAVVEIEPHDFDQEFPAPVDFEEKEEEPETTTNAVPAEATPVVDEKEKVEEKIDFGGLNVNIDAAGQNNAFGMGGSNPKVEGLNEEAAVVDHYEIHFVSPEDEKEFGGAEYFKSLEDAQAKCAEFANDGHSCEIKKLICNDGICSLVSLDEPNAVNEGIHDKSRETIENEQELHGIDNAVVDCKKYTLVAHSEDEKPVDCKLEKPALEEPLAGDKVDVKLYENFEDRLVAEYHKRLDKYAPKFGFANGEELDAAMENDPDLCQEVIEFDDGDNFLDLYLN